MQIIVFVCCCHGCIGMDFPILEDREEIKQYVAEQVKSHRDTCSLKQRDSVLPLI